MKTNNGEAQPLVSVVMPAYRAERYIDKAIESVLAQQVSLELLVIDDCSPDGTAQRVLEYCDGKQVRYLKNETNRGVSYSRNRGVQEAKGEYIAYLDADDWWAEGKLLHQLRVMEETGAVMCSTGRELVNPDGTPTGKEISVKEVVTYRELLKHNSINCSSVLIRREAALEFPMCHDESHEDYITWLKVVRKYGFCAGIGKPYLKYRLSEGGKSRNKWKSAQMTFRVYRHMGYGLGKSCLFFISYALHGLKKYL